MKHLRLTGLQSKTPKSIMGVRWLHIPFSPTLPVVLNLTDYSLAWISITTFSRKPDYSLIAPSPHGPLGSWRMAKCIANERACSERRAKEKSEEEKSEEEKAGKGCEGDKTTEVPNNISRTEKWQEGEERKV